MPLAPPPVLHIGQRSAFTRVVVDLPHGVRLPAPETDVEALDADPADGRAVVRATAPGLAVRRVGGSGAGLRVRLRPRPNGISVLLTATPGSLKFVSYSTPASGRQLVIDLWRNTTSSAARIRSDGCLRIDTWNLASYGTVSAQGRELTPLFEHGLVLSLRLQGASAPISEKPLIASEGTFRPDFSGYSVPGRWSGRLSYPIPIEGPRLRRRAMLEAWSSSAKDGSLDCLVQVPVIIG